MPARTKRLSFIAIAVVLATCGIVDLDLRLWTHQERVIEWDVHGYYGYLPAHFIYDDIRLEKSSYQVDEDHFLFWPNITPEGHKLFKYPVGEAFLFAPFFGIAHALAPMVGAPPDGFSEPYKCMLLIGALFYLCSGLLLLDAVLRRSGFSDATIALGLLLVGLGTNLFCFSTQSAAMPHVLSFFVMSAFLLTTLRWYERTTLWRTMQVGAVFGLLTLLRPTDAVAGLFFLFAGITEWGALRARMAFLLSKLPILLVALLTMIAVWTPQLLYWHTVTGSLVYYSYQDEGFFFGHPHLLEGLFGARKGWFVYTPLMLFAVAGLGLLRGRARGLLGSISVVLVVHLFITLSWWCWWYGGCFGLRPMIAIYPLMVIPLCAFIDRMRAGRLVMRLSSVVVALSLIVLNIFQTYQFEVGALHYDAMTWKLYLKQFGSMEPVDGGDPDLGYPNYERALETGR